jgi:hypothetical protein
MKALDGGECSASRFGLFTSRERAHLTHWIGGWVDPREVLDAVKRKILSLRRESNPRTSIVQPVAQRYTDYCAQLNITPWSRLGRWRYRAKYWALDGSEWSASRSGSFTTMGRTQYMHLIGGWVGSRANVDALTKRENNSCPCRQSNPCHTVRSSITDLPERNGIQLL